MILVDVILVVLLIAALLVGFGRGLFASVGPVVGLVAGGFAAFWVMPLVNAWTPWAQWRSLLVLLAGVGVVLVGIGVGAAIGGALRRGVDHTPLRGIERFLGGVASVLVAALAIILVAPTIALTGMPQVAAAVSSSQVVAGIQTVLPDGVEARLAELRTAMLGEALPQLGVLVGPGRGTVDAPIALDDPDLQQASASVARVSGIAYACGSGASGSGFAIAPNLVVTNAHVVAGVDTPVVELPGRPAREGRIVYFDPIDDLAVVAVDDLAAVPLDLAPVLGAGVSAAVQGYPNGGPFSSVNAAVLSVGTVPVPDVYAESTNPREVYALDAVVQPGNSGGPLLTDEGDVAGVVFARGLDGDDRGYAMTVSELEPIVSDVDALDAAVSSGRCTTG